MSSGFGQFHVVTDAGRKAYRTFDEADKARDFLEALGIHCEIEMNTKKRQWEPETATGATPKITLRTSAGADSNGTSTGPSATKPTTARNSDSPTFGGDDDLS